MSNPIYDGPRNLVVTIPSGGPGAVNEATRTAPAGLLIRRGGIVWRYVKFDSGTHAVAAVAGGVVHWKTLNPATGDFVVTSDYSDGIGGKNTVAGVLSQAGVTTLHWTWIQVGPKVNAKVAFSTVAGDKCIGTSTDLSFGRIAAGSNNTDIVYAVALASADQVLGTANVLLQGLDW